jgi:hypothetical protein
MQRERVLDALTRELVGQLAWQGAEQVSAARAQDR